MHVNGILKDTLEIYYLNGEYLNSFPKLIEEKDDWSQKASSVKTPLTSFPVQLCAFTHLQVIYLANNKLEEIPPEVSKIAQLRKLFFQNNHLEDLPSSLSLLTRLDELNLSENQLSKVPAVLKKMFWIKKLDLTSNLIDSIPFQILRFPHASAFLLETRSRAKSFEINLVLAPEISLLNTLFYQTLTFLCFPLIPNPAIPCDHPDCHNTVLKEHCFIILASMAYKKGSLRFKARACSLACTQKFEKSLLCTRSKVSH